MATAFKKMLAKKQEKSESSSSKDNEDQASVSSSDQEVEIDPVSFDYDLSCYRSSSSMRSRMRSHTPKSGRIDKERL